MLHVRGLEIAVIVERYVDLCRLGVVCVKWVVSVFVATRLYA
jgi:hypothetical protein